MNIEPGSVWLDARGTQSASHSERGIPRYVAEHARALVRREPTLIGSVALDPSSPFPHSMDPLMGSGLLTWHSNTGPSGRPVPGIYHVMSPFEIPLGYDEIWPAWVRDSRCRLVVTLYDLIPVVMRDQYLADWGDWATAWTARLGLMRAAHQVVTISKQTAADAIELLHLPEERVTAIESGVSGHFASLIGSRAESEALIASALPGIRPGFLLYVGGKDYRKNLDGTIAGYARLPESLQAGHQLVIAGNLTRLHRAELRAFAREQGVGRDDIQFTGFIQDRVLAALYRSCELFVFPSLYEGAGLPILEAMSCGAPVVTSNVSSMPELLGDMDGTFDPADPDDIGRCLQEVLETPERLDSLRERSRRQVKVHTWDRVARLTIEGYERALSVPLGQPAGRGARSRRRKRLAVVTPWPPQASPVARHSRALVEELSAHADVEVIVSGEEEDIGFDRSLDGVPIRTAAQFEWLRELEGYDRCLYVLGGDRIHLHALEALIRVPGAALVHDVRLLGLYSDLHRHRHLYDPYWLEDKLSEMYGDRMARVDLRRIPYDNPHQNQQVPMTREIQSHARLLFVHSHHQAELLQLDRPPGGAPTEVVPHGIPSLPVSTNGHAGNERPRVAAISSPALRPKIVEAFGELRSGGTLRILGDVDERERASIQAMAGRLGIGEVELPDRLDGGAYLDAVARADLAVELRAGADGGTASSTVCDCIAARVPTIVSGTGWQSELPEPVVLQVATDCSATELSEQMGSALRDSTLKDEIRASQDAYAAETSFARVAERLAELLSLG